MSSDSYMALPKQQEATSIIYTDSKPNMPCGHSCALPAWPFAGLPDLFALLQLCVLAADYD